MTKIFNKFRKYAKEVLKQKHITYLQLANLIQMQESTIKGFMCGASDSRRVAEKIADVLDCGLRYENGEYLLVNKEDKL